MMRWDGGTLSALLAAASPGQPRRVRIRPSNLYGLYENERRSVSNSYAFVSSIGGMNHFTPKSGIGGACDDPPGMIVALPRRPDASFISETIPLFYIGQNDAGFWVARGADGRAGGIFLFRRSALQFARKCSEPAGCATMFLDERLELDVENQGSPLAAELAATLRFAALHTPRLVVAVAVIGQKLFRRLSRALASERAHREAIEQQLFHGWYMLSSKNDDDLPIVLPSELE